MRLGAIADDVTGGTDLASLISREGRRVILSFGVPARPLPAADALVIATKTRMAPVLEAKSVAAEAAIYLSGAGAKQLYFKYCSTFDSTEKGNIGPVIETLLAHLADDFTVACPSYPAYARTVYQGHLFVGDRLISESSMRHHPLTPMTDPDLVRFLARQTSLSTGLLALRDVDAGNGAVRKALGDLRGQGRQIVVADAILDRHVATLAEACADMKLVSGGAPLGGALVTQHGAASSAARAPLPARHGPVVLLSGSCSAASLAQVRNVLDLVPSRVLDPLRLVERPQEIVETIDWARDKARAGKLLIYSTADTLAVGKAQSHLGREIAAGILESAFGEIAAALAQDGARTFVVAGGETSGAVMQALRVRTLTFGEELDPGVPWTYSLDPEGYTFALKSGNFGGPDFFRRALG